MTDAFRRGCNWKQDKFGLNASEAQHMRIIVFSIGLLAGRGGSQPPAGAPSLMPQSRAMPCM
jgi:hypothetical protein